MAVTTRQAWRSGMLVLLAGLTACGGSASTPQPRDPSPPPPMQDDPLPRLPAGPHIGIKTGFDPLSAAQEARVSDLRRDAITAGLSIARVQIDWADLEPSPGQFDRDELRSALNRATEGGLSPWILVSTLDTDGFTLPADLLNDDGTALRDGLRLDGTLVRDRFSAFLDWLLPELNAFDVWAVSIGNEVESIFEDDPPLEAQSLAFLTDGLRQIRRDAPQIAATVTLTGGADRAYPDFARSLTAEMDIVALNYYCLADDLTVSDRATWEADLDRFQQVYAGRPIVFQELGCPTGFATPDGTDRARTGGSPEIQSAFYDYTLGRLVSDEPFRAASLFQLHDWSPELADMTAQPLRDSDNAEIRRIGDRLDEWLRTVGLCNWPDLTCRPAWETVLAELTDVREARP